jgi:hypothetical protein
VADFDFTVDTTEMADSIRGVSHHVNGVTAAVVTMQLAVVYAEKAGADRICENVDRGFYSLIRSQITQKIAALRSKVDSRIMEMRQQAVSLGAVKTRMERDFNMIANRYGKLFRSLDASLSSKVFELDKAAVKLVSKDISQITSRARAMQASVPMHQIETINTREEIAAAHIKANAARAITSMHRFVLGATQQRLLVSRMLGDVAATENRICSLPIIVFESDALRTQLSQWGYRIPVAPDRAIAAKLERAIQNAVYGDLANRGWGAADRAQVEQITLQFRRTTESSAVSERVRKQMMTLFTNSAWQQLTGVKA